MQAEIGGKSGHEYDIFSLFLSGLRAVPDSTEITRLLKAWSGGDQAALGRLAEQVYGELRVIARRYMKNERPDNTLQTTALVHEVYLRLVDTSHVQWDERAQFFAMAPTMMRRIRWMPPAPGDRRSVAA